MTYRMLSSLIILLTVLAGCSETIPNSPPKITLGQDPCDNCFMIINEKKFAASAWLENGETKRFDDIGCMIDFFNKKKINVKSFWVYDFINNEPTQANNACFMDSDSIITPMGFGIVAFKSKNEAFELVEKYKTKLISFDELKNKYSKLKTEK